MPLQAGNEEVDVGVARPQEEGLALSPIRDTARSRTGSAPPDFASRDVLTALEVVDLMEGQYHVWDKEKRLYGRLPQVEESPKTYAEVELFLTAIEEEAERAGLPDKLYELAINQMSISLATSYRRLAATKFPDLSPTYERLVEAMVESMAPGKPEGHLLKEIRTLEAGKMGVRPLREQLERIYQKYLALCRWTRKVPVITEQTVVGIYLRFWPEDLGAQLRDLVSDADFETLCAVTKFVAARADRRTTHPLLWDARGLTGVSGDVRGFLPFRGELSGSRDPAFADREPRAPAIPAAMGVNRLAMRKARDRQSLTVDEGDFLIGMHGRRCPPHASHRDRVSRGPGTVLRMFQDGTKGTRYPEAVQLVDTTPRTRARRGGRRPTCRMCSPRHRNWRGRQGQAFTPWHRGEPPSSNRRLLPPGGIRALRAARLATG